MIKKYFYLSLLLLLNLNLKSQTLSAGDIAIIGYNYDASPQEMTIVTLAPIGTGTIIRITDYGYDESTGTFGATSVANSAEGSIQWTTTSSITTGTVIKFTITSGATPVVSGLPGTVSVTGWTNSSTTTSPVSAGGDNWFIFQGSSPTSIANFIFGYINTFAVTFNSINQPAGQFIATGSGSPNNNNSYLPPSLNLATTAIAINRDPFSGGYHGDNNVYIGTRTGTKTAILTEICKQTNWVRSETAIQDINPGGANFPGTNPIFTITLTTEDFIKSKFKIYPNPVLENLNMNFEDLENVSIQIVDISGKVLRKEALDNKSNSINVSNLTSGIYFIKITSNKGNATIKFSKE